MSIEIYCSRFRHQERAPFSDPELATAFASVGATRQGPDGTLASARGDALCERLSMQLFESKAWSLTFLRPSTEDLLYRALLVLLGMEGVVVHAPGSPIIVGNPRTGEHIPGTMLSALGAPHFVDTPVALVEALFGSGAQGPA